ncbi:hypothetical protein ACSBR2_015924 [Camellia fascicularis]
MMKYMIVKIIRTGTMILLLRRMCRLTSPNSQRGRKKMFELRLKRNEARKANQTAMVLEKKRMEAPPESKGVSKEKWTEERKKNIGKLLDSNVFNQKTLYNAYKKLSKNIEIDIEEYNKMKEVDPEFYREASSLQYGKAPKVAEDKIKMMVKELKDRDEKQEEKGPSLVMEACSIVFSVILNMFTAWEVVHVVKSDSRLANNDLPVDIQRLRCRALYYALRFSPSIDNLGKVGTFVSPAFICQINLESSSSYN